MNKPLSPSTLRDRCRVRIVNDITGRVTIVESPRRRSHVFIDIAKLVKNVNRCRDLDDVVKVSLHLTEELIVLHFHCPGCDDELAMAVVDAVPELVGKVERLIWEGGYKG